MEHEAINAPAHSAKGRVAQSPEGDLGDGRSKWRDLEVGVERGKETGWAGGLEAERQDDTVATFPARAEGDADFLAKIFGASVGPTRTRSSSPSA